MGVAQAVTERIERRPRPIYIFGGVFVRGNGRAAGALMIIIERNLAYGTRKRHRQLAAWIHFTEEHLGDGIAGSPRRKWATVQSVYNDVTVPGIESIVHRRDKEALEFDVTRCPYAEFFRALGEPELGAFLVCETDFDIAAAGEGEVSLERAQTIMQGAPSCTFRYKFAPR